MYKQDDLSSHDIKIFKTTPEQCLIDKFDTLRRLSHPYLQKFFDFSFESNSVLVDLKN